MRSPSREREATFIALCVNVARGAKIAPLSQADANVLAAAATITSSRFPVESARMKRVSEEYFAQHPKQALPLPEMVRRGWVMGVPRFRDFLMREMRKESSYE